MEYNMHLQDISATAFLPLQTSVRHQEYSPLSTPLLLDTPAVMDTVFFVHYNANKPREESLIDKVNGQKDMSLFTERQELTHNCCLHICTQEKLINVNVVYALFLLLV
jgi:hypothetical protein